MADSGVLGINNLNPSQVNTGFVTNAKTLTESIKNFSPSENMVTIIVVIMSILVSLYVIFYLYKLFMKTNLETVTLLKNPIKIPSDTVKIINADQKLPSLRNGTEFAYSFWMYINNFEKTDNKQMILFGGQNEVAENPIFYLDGDYVKLFAEVKTNGVSPCSKTTLSVDYIPRQRWVNICLVVDNEFIQLFVDGDLRKVVDVSETMVDSTSNTECSNRLVEKNSDNIYIGRLPTTSTIDGFLSKVQFFNYALTIDHVKMIYNSGPLYQNILTKIGIPLYGIRNPFFRIDQVANDENEDVQ